MSLFTEWPDISRRRLLLASLSLPAIFSDHAVLLQSEETPVWGKGSPGAEIVVSLGGEKARAQVSPEGKWKASLDLSRAGAGPHTLIVEAKEGGGGERIEVRDVLVGEVWFAAGQSNMMFRIDQSSHANSEEANVAMPWLREFRPRVQAGSEAADDTQGRWTVAIPPANQRFGAVTYYFGKRILESVGRPVAIINTSWSNTPIEPWISPAGLKGDAALSEDAARAEAFFQAQPKDIAPLPLQARHVPGYIYNGMIAPFTSYAIRGFLWYQGESNTSRAALYREAFPLLVRDWRARWNRGELPFYFCQLPNFRPKETSPDVASPWAELREAQATALQLPRTGMAVLIDVGEEGDLHPREKKTAGERLAALTLTQYYHQTLACSGPCFLRMEIKRGKAYLYFDRLEGGLVARPLPATYRRKSTDQEEFPLLLNSPGSPLQGFAIAGRDRRFHWASASIEGESVVVFSPKVPQPEAVRYALADNPTCNLYNKAGFPAAHFRTDNFPLSTKDIRLSLPKLPVQAGAHQPPRLPVEENVKR